MKYLFYLAPLISVVGIVFAYQTAKTVTSHDPGTPRMQEMSKAIRDGANAFLSSQYRILLIFILIVFGAIGFGLKNWDTAVCFLVGSGLSTLAGFIGMRVATKANVRTANAARTSGMAKALSIAFGGGSVMGFCVSAFGLWVAA